MDEGSDLVWKETEINRLQAKTTSLKRVTAGLEFCDQTTPWYDTLLFSVVISASAEEGDKSFRFSS